MRTQAKVKIEKPQEEVNPYAVGAESVSVQEKLQVLEAMGREDLIGIFKNWQPRQARSKRKSAPLDQRVSITVTDKERVALTQDLKAINKAGEKVTVSHFVRNRALGSIDINGWREIAESALEELNEIEENRAAIVKRERQLRGLLEEEEDQEQVGMFELELAKVHEKLRKVTAQNEKRTNRLSGRMSMAEAETVKWRAARLCISTSDYLRFLIFDLLPNSAADGHMSVNAKRRFYISILDVADNGWGEPPSIAHCTQCVNYMDEIRNLRERLRLMETFL